MKLSKCKVAGVNDIGIDHFPLFHANLCDTTLNSSPTHLTHPPINYREISINRFYNLPINPQDNRTIFWNFATNTKLEAKDNHRERIPRHFNQWSGYPSELV